MIKLILFGILKGIGIFAAGAAASPSAYGACGAALAHQVSSGGRERAAVSGSLVCHGFLGQSVPMAAIHLRGAVGSS